MNPSPHFFLLTLCLLYLINPLTPVLPSLSVSSKIAQETLQLTLKMAGGVSGSPSKLRNGSKRLSGAPLSEPDRNATKVTLLILSTPLSPPSPQRSPLLLLLILNPLHSSTSPLLYLLLTLFLISESTGGVVLVRDLSGSLTLPLPSPPSTSLSLTVCLSLTSFNMAVGSEQRCRAGQRPVQRVPVPHPLGGRRGVFAPGCRCCK